LSADTDIVAGENRRLNKELKELHARLAAFESSRWWRLHPRFVLAGLVRRASRAAPSRQRPEELRTSAANTPEQELIDRYREQVVARGEFSHDWFTVHIPAWEPVLRRLEGRRARLLELGSFEGMSACFLLWRLPDASLTAIDTFAGLQIHQAYGVSTSQLEDTFDRNVALVDASRVRKLVGESRRLLARLLEEGLQYDFIYVDASHRALDVLVDASLSWQLLAPGGFLVFDDYGSVPVGDDPLLRPTVAIDAFRAVVAAEAELEGEARQLILRKADATPHHADQPPSTTTFAPVT
jgi:predicted O-methyltransferase YrrM